MIVQLTIEYELDANEVVKQYPNFYRSYSVDNGEDPEGFIRLLFEDHFSSEDAKEFLDNFGKDDYTEINYVG